MSKETNPASSAPPVKTSPKVEQDLSQVAINPKQNILILVGIVAVFIYLSFNLFAGDDGNEQKPEPTPIPKEITRPVQLLANDDAPPIPTLPEPPKLEEPTPPPPPPPEPEALLPLPLPELPSVTTPQNAPPLPFLQPKTDESARRADEKRKSGIILMGGAPPAKTEDQLLEESNFKYRGNMNLVLGRGKILSAIIETAVNTDFGGEIRALISRDVYSEWGKNILIPKGSRIFGSYATGINGAYGRISITWTRVDLATGYTLNLAGTGIDALGRTGNQGRVDNKFKERLSNAVLKSILDISLAKALDSIVKPQINSQTAAARSVGATNLTSIANAIFTQPGLTAKEKRAKICQDVLTAIANKTSNSFLKLSMTCNTLNTDPVASEPNKLLSLMGIINQLSDELIKDVTADSEKTQVQEASEKSFEAISDSIKSMAEEQDFHPTITIPQGTAVKIYVNKDYKFPKKAVIKSRFLK